MATLELNSSVARPKKHGEVVLRRCTAKPHATTIKRSLHLPPVGVQRALALNVVLGVCLAQPWGEAARRSRTDN